MVMRFLGLSCRQSRRLVAPKTDDEFERSGGGHAGERVEIALEVSDDRVDEHPRVRGRDRLSAGASAPRPRAVSAGRSSVRRRARSRAMTSSDGDTELGEAGEDK